MKHRSVDFAAVKAAIKLRALAHRDRPLETTQRGSDSLSGRCAIHNRHIPAQFRLGSFSEEGMQLTYLASKLATEPLAA